MKWADKKEVKKGDVGEDYVDEHMIDRGYIRYIPDPDIDASHPIDRLYMKNDITDVLFLDVKTKEARIFYPDTGINIKACNKYKSIFMNTGIDVYLAFVDATAEKVYGNKLSHLLLSRQVEHTVKGELVCLNYPITLGGIIYFPLDEMEFISVLPDHVCSHIYEHTTVNEAYR